MGSMKVQHFARKHDYSLTLGCKRLRPLVPKLAFTTTSPACELGNFTRPENGSRKLGSGIRARNAPLGKLQGGTRWSPTQEQLGILEMLFRSGVRTPSAQQIEHITAQLGKYGKIEGKNVFYWFQNHKAREKQKQKRDNSFRLEADEFYREVGKEEDRAWKRKCSWSFGCLEEESGRSRKEEENRTLQLFPLHPESRQ